MGLPCPVVRRPRAHPRLQPGVVRRSGQDVCNGRRAGETGSVVAVAPDLLQSRTWADRRSVPVSRRARYRVQERLRLGTIRLRCSDGGTGHHRGDDRHGARTADNVRVVPYEPAPDPTSLTILVFFGLAET